MKKIGMVTYHSAYNFGSVLQAYATQKVLEDLGYYARILNYRMKSQDEYYGIIHIHSGIKNFLRDLVRIPFVLSYIRRKHRFEKFISNLDLTEKFSEPENAKDFSNSFDIFISGSDQVWNKHSNELKFVDWKYMYPYLLDFTEKKKISYASSIVNMTDGELKQISDKIKSFNAVSFREASSCERIFKLTGMQSEFVLDPTLLLTKQDWNNIVGKLPSKLKGKKYVLYYALEGIRDTNTNFLKLRRFARQHGYVIAMITPLSSCICDKYVYNMLGAGPAEFLSLINNAEMVITNSYHGTLFSINFEVDFYTLRKLDSTDNRISEVLSLFGLDDRIITNLDEIPYKLSKIDFSTAFRQRKIYTHKSVLYLRKALGEL